MSQREGHAVAANFGSAATELAICVKRVGLAVRSDLDALEIAGPEPWLAHFLEGVARRPCSGAGRGRAHSRQLVLPRRARSGHRSRPLERRRPLELGSCAMRSSPARPWTARDRSDSATALTLVGPRAEQLLEDARLEPDLPVGGVRESWFAGTLALILREDRDRFMLLLDADHAVDAWQELFDAGRALGLSMVGAEALERLAAAPGRIF